MATCKTSLNNPEMNGGESLFNTITAESMKNLDWTTALMSSCSSLSKDASKICC
jgi:hypothetical protein